MSDDALGPDIPSPHNRRIDPGMVQKMFALREYGLTAKEIAMRLGCGESTIWDHLKSRQRKKADART